MKKLAEHTYGTSIFMRLMLDSGEIHEISNYCGADCSWEHFKTTADGNENKRKEVVKAFKKLY